MSVLGHLPVVKRWLEGGAPLSQTEMIEVIDHARTLGLGWLPFFASDCIVKSTIPERHDIDRCIPVFMNGKMIGYDKT